MVIEGASDLIARNSTDSNVYKELKAALLNTKDKYTLPERFRALFALKNLATSEAIDCIAAAFVDHSALMKHELAYCLGQMGNKRALFTLESVLRDLSEHPMVRHEAAEAMGAIGHSSSCEILMEYSGDAEVSVAETCQLALDKIRQGGDKNEKSLRYQSVDPAPPFPVEMYSVVDLERILMDASLSLFERYRAMFSLRDEGSIDAVRALGNGLLHGNSALFRHEIAFIFGQMLDPKSIAVLQQTLGNKHEESMVRHECAEALGSIARQESLTILENHANSDDVIVRESCEVALDMWRHETNPESFHYASLE